MKQLYLLYKIPKLSKAVLLVWLLACYGIACSPQQVPVSTTTTGAIQTLSDQAQASIHLPPTAPPYPVVIDLHGCNGIWPERNHEWLLFFLNQGIAVVQVDSFSLRGESNICDDVYRVPAMTRTFDVAAAIQFVEQDARFKQDAMFLTGMSHGGTTALLTNLYHSSVFAKLRGVVAYYPWCLDVMPVLNTDVLILIGGQDDWTPASRCEEMRVLQQGEHTLMLQVYAKAYHSFDARIPTSTYQGYRVGYDQTAAQNSRALIKEFIAQRLP